MCDDEGERHFEKVREDEGDDAPGQDGDKSDRTGVAHVDVHEPRGAKSIAYEQAEYEGEDLDGGAEFVVARGCPETRSRK